MQIARRPCALTAAVVAAALTLTLALATHAGAATATAHRHTWIRHGVKIRLSEQLGSAHGFPVIIGRIALGSADGRSHRFIGSLWTQIDGGTWQNRQRTNIVVPGWATRPHVIVTSMTLCSRGQVGREIAVRDTTGHNFALPNITC